MLHNSQTCPSTVSGLAHFEALRAKILFSEGAHKHKNSRPKFERRDKERLVFLPEVPVDLPPLTDELYIPEPNVARSSSTPSQLRLFHA
jgi:hypothetical protein